ncbi:MAG: serine hydrolase [Bacteroidetes bacterium]|nr:serine hydrolase [Bacteroidota bacterium]MBS1972995.1 serine hydrolase [Bacteroidota bacterium]
MPRIACCLFIIFSFLKTAGQAPAQEIDELMKAYYNQNSFNGSLLVAEKGDILLEKGYGLKNARAKTPNDPNTVFQIGSITKQFTSAIILQLEEQHKLSLQDKLSKYIPGYPRGDSMTIENLLTHTSGIYNYTSDTAFMNNNATNPVKLDSLIALFRGKPLDFRPGEKFSYSNSGYILLGYIIEKVTGKPYFTVVKENIFNPLGMTRSGFDFTGLKNPDKATGYFMLTVSHAVPAGIVDSSVSYSAGAMYSTVGDLYKWDRALYTDKIIHDSSMQKAFMPYKNKYGYGWAIDSSYGKKVVMHQGSIFGFVSFMARIPSDQVCIILLDNKQSPGLAKMAENINAILNQQPYDFPIPKKEISVDTSILKKYVGRYQLAPGFFLDISLENGRLLAQATGQGESELFAEKENLFYQKLADIEIEFIGNVQGKVDRLVLYQSGEKFPALKIK